MSDRTDGCASDLFRLPVAVFRYGERMNPFSSPSIFARPAGGSSQLVAHFFFTRFFFPCGPRVRVRLARVPRVFFDRVPRFCCRRRSGLVTVRGASLACFFRVIFSCFRGSPGDRRFFGHFWPPVYQDLFGRLLLNGSPQEEDQTRSHS